MEWPRIFAKSAANSTSKDDQFACPLKVFCLWGDRSRKPKSHGRIGLSYGALFSEVVVLGSKVGVSPQTIGDVISPSRMGKGSFETFMADVVDRNHDAHKFSIANATKDLRYLNDMASETNAMSIMAGAAKHCYTHVEAMGHADDYVPMLSDHVGSLNGLNIEDEVRKGSQRTPQ